MSPISCPIDVPSDGSSRAPDQRHSVWGDLDLDCLFGTSFGPHGHGLGSSSSSALESPSSVFAPFDRGAVEACLGPLLPQ